MTGQGATPAPHFDVAKLLDAAESTSERIAALDCCNPTRSSLPDRSHAPSHGTPLDGASFGPAQFDVAKLLGAAEEGIKIAEGKNSPILSLTPSCCTETTRSQLSPGSPLAPLTRTGEPTHLLSSHGGTQEVTDSSPVTNNERFGNPAPTAGVPGGVATNNTSSSSASPASAPLSYHAQRSPDALSEREGGEKERSLTTHSGVSSLPPTSIPAPFSATQLEVSQRSSSQSIIGDHRPGGASASPRSDTSATPTVSPLAPSATITRRVSPPELAPGPSIEARTKAPPQTADERSLRSSPDRGIPAPLRVDPSPRLERDASPLRAPRSTPRDIAVTDKPELSGPRSSLASGTVQLGPSPLNPPEHQAIRHKRTMPEGRTGIGRPHAHHRDPLKRESVIRKDPSTPALHTPPKRTPTHRTMKSRSSPLDISTRPNVSSSRAISMAPTHRHLSPHIPHAVITRTVALLPNIRTLRGDMYGGIRNGVVRAWSTVSEGVIARKMALILSKLNSKVASTRHAPPLIRGTARVAKAMMALRARLMRVRSPTPASPRARTTRVIRPRPARPRSPSIPKSEIAKRVRTLTHQLILARRALRGAVGRSSPRPRASPRTASTGPRDIDRYARLLIRRLEEEIAALYSQNEVLEVDDEVGGLVRKRARLLRGKRLKKLRVQRERSQRGASSFSAVRDRRTRTREERNARHSAPKSTPAAIGSSGKMASRVSAPRPAEARQGPSQSLDTQQAEDKKRPTTPQAIPR